MRSHADATREQSRTRAPSSVPSLGPLLFAGLCVIALTLGGAACDRAPEGEPLPATTVGQRASAALASAMATLAPSASATSAAEAEPKPEPPPSTLLGVWEASYDAKKGEVLMPELVKDEGRAKDDGKAHAGPGTVRIVVGDDGSVTGESKGALGEATFSGHADGNLVRAQFNPKDPAAKGAMTGVLVGLLKEGFVQAELRVAGPDALVVREAKLKLERPGQRPAASATPSASAAASSAPKAK